MVTPREDKGIYGLVGSPERLKILEELRSGPKDRGYFINLLRLWPQAVKYHIDILVNGKLVAERWAEKGRKKKIYSLTKEGERAMSKVLPGRRFPGDDWVELFVGPRGRNILSFLASVADGKWHDLREARQRIGDREIEALNRNDMLEIDAKGSKIRMKEFSLAINSDWIRSLAGRDSKSDSRSGVNPWST